MHTSATIKPGPTTLTPRWLKWTVCMALCTLLAACGFKLKGATPLPFDTIYTNITENSAFGARVRRAIIASSPHTRFVTDPQQAQVRLTQLANRQSLRELSINAEGQVEEYELNLEFTFQMTDSGGRLILPPTTLQSVREVPYDPSVLQAKQGEIGTLFLDMQQGLVDRIVRRITSPDVAEAFQSAAALPAEQMPETVEPASPDIDDDSGSPAFPSPLPGMGIY